MCACNAFAVSLRFFRPHRVDHQEWLYSAALNGRA